MKQLGGKNGGRGLLAVGCIVLGLAMALQFAVNTQLTLYSDDYWYGTFFQQGLWGFLRNTAQHYLTTNGRVFVHILIPILLLGGMAVFAVVSPACTALLFLLGLRVQNRSLGKGALLLAGGMGLLSLLGSEIQYLRMALYWLSAYFNYAFPLLFPLAVLWGAEKARQGTCKKWGFVLLCLCAFLAGASTEQVGLVALVVIVGGWLLWDWRKPGKEKKLYLLPVLTAGGYATILLAPGSHARMGRGIDGGILSVLDPQVFLSRFFDVMGYLCGYPFWNLLFGALCLLLALLCLVDKSLPRHLFSGFGAAALVLVLALAGQGQALAVFTVAYTLYAAVTLLFFPTYQATGLLLLGAGASVMMLIVTTLYYARTFFPCVLLFLIVAWGLLFRLLPRCPRPAGAVVLAVLAAVSLVRYVPILQGYVANKAVIDQNLEAIEEARTTGELSLCIDLDPDYRFTMFFEGNYFLQNFLQYYRLPADIPVEFTSQVWDISGLEAGGRMSTFPCLEKGGELLVPVEFLFQATGNAYTFHWTDHTASITFQGEGYTLYEDGRLYKGDALVDSSCALRMPFSYTYTLLYLPAADLERCFGITLEYDAQQGCYRYPG